jgi:hypothetical protein
VAAAAPPEARKVAAAMEAVERDAAAIAESYASLFASLRIALSNVCVLLTAASFPSFLPSMVVIVSAHRAPNSAALTHEKVTSTSSENMECLGEVVGRLQESGFQIH